MPTMCDVCHVNRATLRGRYALVFKKRVCTSCQLKPEYHLICLTDTKREYGLKEDDLEYLTRHEINNGVYGFCTYFLLRDVKEYHEEKHCILKEKIEKYLQDAKTT